MLNNRIHEYLKGFTAHKQEHGSEQKVAVSDAVSALAFYYEKIRNAMEYQDDHLMRQGAIRRIVGRRMMFAQNPVDLSGALVRELVRSRYLPNNAVPLDVVKKVEKIIFGYLGILESLKKQHLLNDKNQDWILNILSCALDELFMPVTAEEGLVRLMAHVLEPYLQKSFPGVDERIKKGQLVIACYRILLRPNINRLQYFLLKQGFSVWVNGGLSDSDARAKEVPDIMQRIDSAIMYPLNGRLQGVFRRFRIAFIVLHSIVRQKGEHILDNADTLSKEVKAVCEKMYASQRKRLVGRTIRAFIYIFLTKMVLGLSIEIPYDLFTEGVVNIRPLLLNIIFPPFVLAAMAFSVRVPGTNNTQEIIQAIREIVFEDTPQKVFVPQKIAYMRRGMAIATVFNILYGVLSLISIGLFAWILYSLDFSIVSGVILFFFLSLVMFFGITLRRMVSDLVLIKTKDRFFWLFIGQFFDPIMRLGQWLAFRISKINVLVFVFDILIELPFQALIEITEEWFSFMREKKDELEHR